MVPPSHVDRVELERAQPLDDAQDAGGRWWQAARRRQQVAEHQVAAGNVARDGAHSSSGVAAVSAAMCADLDGPTLDRHDAQRAVVLEDGEPHLGG